MSTPAFTVDVSGVYEAARVLSEDAQAIAGGILAAGMVEMGNAVRRQVRAQVKGHRRTGKLSSHVGMKRYGVGFSRIVRVYSGGSVAILITKGASPHVEQPGKIMPMREGRGAFKRGAGAGVIGFRRVVHHPGFRGDPYFKRGADAAQGEIDAILTRTITEVASLVAEQIEGG